MKILSYTIEGLCEFFILFTVLGVLGLYLLVWWVRELMMG